MSQFDLSPWDTRPADMGPRDLDNLTPDVCPCSVCTANRQAGEVERSEQ